MEKKLFTGIKKSNNLLNTKQNDNKQINSLRKYSNNITNTKNTISPIITNKYINNKEVLLNSDIPHKAQESYNMYNSNINNHNLNSKINIMSKINNRKTIVSGKTSNKENNTIHDSNNINDDKQPKTPYVKYLSPINHKSTHNNKINDKNIIEKDYINSLDSNQITKSSFKNSTKNITNRADTLNPTTNSTTVPNNKIKKQSSLQEEEILLQKIKEAEKKLSMNKFNIDLKEAELDDIKKDIEIEQDEFNELTEENTRLKANQELLRERRMEIITQESGSVRQSK